MDKSILTKTLKFCIILLLFLGIYFAIRYTLSIIFPMIIVLILASLIEPAVKFIHIRLKIPRALASAVTLLCLLLIIVGFIILMITEIYEGVSYLSDVLPEQLYHFGAIIEQFFNYKIVPIYEQFLALFNQLATDDKLIFQEYIGDLFSNIASIVGLFFQNLLFAIPRNLAVIPEYITVVFFILLGSFLLSADFSRVKQFFIQHIPIKVSTKLKEIGFYVKKSTFGYLKAQFILVAISFHLIFIGLFFIGVEHAFTIALFMIIIDLIPFLGTGLLFVPWIGYSFLTGNYTLTIGLSVVYGIVIITRQLIEPKVFAVNMSIHPLAWLVAAFVGMKIWGLIGLLFAPLGIVLFKGLHDAGLFRWLLSYINGNN